MPVFPQSTAVHPGYTDAVLWGDKHVIPDRPLAASSTYGKFQALVKDGATWRPTSAAAGDSPEWAANTVTALGDVVIPVTQTVPPRSFVATAVAGDKKTHATTEPTWPTVTGATVVDDQVTWTAQVPIDDAAALADTGDFGILLSVEGVTTGAGETPTFPVVIAGQVARSVITGLPASLVKGDRLGLLILE